MLCLHDEILHLRLPLGIHTVGHMARRALLAALTATAGISLSACTPSYEPPKNSAVPQPLPALIVIQAEQRGYTEGLAAGERIQARRDRAAAAAKEKQAAPPLAEGSAAPAAPETSPIPAVVAPQPQPEFSYSPAGPAIPVTPIPQTPCKKPNSAVCD